MLRRGRGEEISSMLHLKERYHRLFLPGQWRMLFSQERTQFNGLFIFDWRGIQPIIEFNQKVFWGESSIFTNLFNWILVHGVLHGSSIILFGLLCKAIIALKVTHCATVE